ncbi:hypothetical protein [Streptomyces sp. CRN 30]|uniref:hypothetical protein n=1 Tax=Streptomyces sp. CRN 30 TaxID=3075613 RepID=UPI002A83E347|nr:hypothetical protein [Streptomyces sp. CRN 30]
MLGLTLLLSACGTPDVGPRITRTPTSAPGTGGPPTATGPTSATPGAVDLGPAPEDLREVNWRDVRVPGTFCDIPGLITFHDGRATATSRTWGRVDLSREPEPTYGDIGGDRRPEAALGVECNNGGGTAAGQLAFGSVIYASDKGRLTVLRSITPQQQPPGQPPTLLAELRMERGRIEVEERWYRPRDATCCPTGTAVTVWVLDDGRLTPRPPRITS